MLVTFSLGVVSAWAEIYPLGQSSTAGFFQGGYAGPSARGWDFNASAGITVTQLGVNAASSIPMIITLWNDSTQTELAQISINSSASTWVFGNIASPVSLTSGSTYSVIAWVDTIQGQPWYLFNNSPPPEFNPTGTVTYVGGRFGNGIDANTFPTSTLPSPLMYGVADIGYTAVPIPSALMLLAPGLAGLTAMRRKFRKQTY